MNSSRFSKTTPPPPKKLVLLKTTQIDDIITVSAYIATIPDTPSIHTLTFRGPVPLPTNPSDRLRSLSPGAPLYDPYTSEILWPCHGGSPPEENNYYSALNSITEPPQGEPPIPQGTVEAKRKLLDFPKGALEKVGDTRTPAEKQDDAQIEPGEWVRMNTIMLWRIGTHLSLVGAEYTLLQAQERCRPSVMLDRSTVTVGACRHTGFEGCELKLSRQSGSRAQPWMRIPFNTIENGGMTDSLTLLNPSTGSGYLFCFRRKSNHEGDGALFVETVQKSKFGELGGNRSICWRQFRIEGYGKGEGNIAAVVLDAWKEGMGRLYVFRGPDETGVIEYGHLPLRMDGSIDSYESTVTLQGYQKINASLMKSRHVGDVQVLQTEKNLFLLWSENEMVKCCTAAKKSDGFAPEGTKWAEVKMNLARSNVTSSEAKFFGCIVPGAFE